MDAEIRLIALTSRWAAAVVLRGNALLGANQTDDRAGMNHLTDGVHGIDVGQTLEARGAGL